MKKNILTVVSVSAIALLLAACTQQTTQVQVQPTASPATQLDASISGQLDMTDDALTQ